MRRLSASTLKNVPERKKQLIVPTIARTARSLAYSDHYALLDSWNMDGTSNVDAGVYAFTIGVMPAAGTVIPTGKPISNVTEIQIYPFTAGAPRDGGESANSAFRSTSHIDIYREWNLSLTAARWIAPPPTFTQTPYGDRMALEIAEGGSSGVSTRAGGRANFWLDLEYENSLKAYIMRATLVTDLYRFPGPISTFDKITLKFTNPDVPVSFDTDTYHMIPMINGSGFLEFWYGGQRFHSYDYFRVVITGFTSGSAKINDYIKFGGGLTAVYTWSPIGHGIHLEPDVYVLGEGIGAAGDEIVTSTPVYVKIAPLRMLLPMRIRTLDKV